MDETTSARENPNARMVFVDALRGIAAFSVMFFHLEFANIYVKDLGEVVPGPIDLYGSYGRFGVQVFFVISGFVITHSLRNNPATFRSLANFILRRQIRLDPPYWTVLLLTIAWGFVTVPAFCYPSPREVPPAQILANFLYIHRILGVADLLTVAWTLCLEIQFYLLDIALLAMGKLLRGGRRSSTVEALLFLATGAASVAYRSNHTHSAGDMYVWFPYGWCLFAGGALASLSVRDRAIDGYFRSFLMLFVTFSFLGSNRWQADTIVGFSTIVLLWGIGKAGRLTTWLGHSMFQYFGRISYSLYLIHFPVIATVLEYASSRVSAPEGRIAPGWFLVAGIGSILAAHILHVAVERPSMRLASRLKFERPKDDSAPEISGVVSS